MSLCVVLLSCLSTNIWLARLVSKIFIFVIKSGAFTPAAHTIKSASMREPSLVIRPFASASATMVCSFMSTPSLYSAFLAELAMRSGNAGKIRSPASTMVIFKRNADMSGIP